MTPRTLWAQELDEDPTEAVAPAAVDADTAEDEPADEEPRRHPFGWLAALGLLALLLILLGWWVGRDDSVAPTATAPAAAAPAAGAVDAAAKPGGGTDGGLVAGGGVTAGTGGSGTGVKAASKGAGGTGGGATDSGGGTRAVVPGGSNGGGGGGGTTGSGTGVSAGVGADVSSSGVNANVDAKAALAPGGAVTALAITSCATVGNLNPKLDAQATVTFANGYRATGVKVTGLTLLNLLDPNALKVTVGGTPYTVPSGADVKVGLCLAL